MRFLLIIFLAITFTSIKGLSEDDEKKLSDIINLIWPTDGIFSDIIDETKTSDILPTQTATCVCIPYQFCKNVTSCVNDCGTIDLSNTNSSCEDYLTTCCEFENVMTISRIPETGGAEKPKGCGVRNSEGIGYRIKGNDSEAQFAEFPWMVAVLEDGRVSLLGPELFIYQCGGSLIHPQVVLTATHCVLSEDSKYVVRAGEWDTQNRNEILPYQDRIVQNIITHPEYNSGSLRNDIALLILDKPFNIVGNVDTVCLPPAGQSLENTRCFASGWGKDSYEGQGKYQVILKKINLPIIPKDVCQSQLRRTRLGNNFNLHKSFICAGGEKGIDTCKGDGGGPLVCPISGNPHRYYQGGIVGWGVECGLENVPALYTNVPLFRNWVDEHMMELGYGTSSYTF